MNDDRELDAAFAAHADGALEEAYRRYAPALQAAARHVLGTAGDARDCVHDALIRVWSNEGAYRAERGALRAFLDGLRAQRGDLAQTQRGRVTSRSEQRAVSAPAFGIDVAERVAIRTALSTLPREQRDVIELAYWGDFTQAEIVDRGWAIPLGTIKSRAALGLRKLARISEPTGFCMNHIDQEAELYALGMLDDDERGARRRTSATRATRARCGSARRSRRSRR